MRPPTLERNRPRVEAVLGDITQEMTDAVVNAANRELVGGGGVDGAIHRAAGARRLAEALRPLAPCEPGEVRVTPGFALPARYILHTVGPIYRDGRHGEAAILEACYRNCLATADALRLASIAFPAIATGVYGFPPAQAARIAVRTVTQTPTVHVRRVRLVAFDRPTYELYQAALAGIDAEDDISGDDV
jgi:O-acetyl-ADP-ribose deacetylase (regulator of RNase III)